MLHRWYLQKIKTFEFDRLCINSSYIQHYIEEMFARIKKIILIFHTQKILICPVSIFFYPMTAPNLHRCFRNSYFAFIKWAIHFSNLGKMPIIWIWLINISQRTRALKNQYFFSFKSRITTIFTIDLCFTWQTI